MSQSPTSYVPSALVEFNVRSSDGQASWRATIRRGVGTLNRYRVKVAAFEGPDAAVAAVLERFNAINDTSWTVLGSACSVDGGNVYAYPIGPAHLTFPV